jgi:hypothetical protein
MRTAEQHATARKLAIEEVAREALWNMEISMEHRNAEHAVRVRDLRRALELAYERGYAAERAD